MTFAPILMKLDLQKELTEELAIEDVFSFKLFGYEIAIDESVVVSWIIIVAMALLAFLLTRNLKVEGEITKRQALLELAYEKAHGFFLNLIGEKGERYIPWLMSTCLFIGVSNMIGLFGFKPPTKSMQITAAMAITSIVLVEYAAFKERGFKGRLKAFTKPIWIVTPINVMELFTKPLSLAMRLFGNVLAAFTIMELLKIVTRAIYIPGIPAIFSLYFDLFDGLLQAYIFVFLTGLYIKESVEVEQENPKKKKITIGTRRRGRKIVEYS